MIAQEERVETESAIAQTPHHYKIRKSAGSLMRTEMKLEGKLKKMLQEFRVALEELYGEQFSKLVLYGSYARNEATEDSDVDVAIVLKGTISPVNEIFRVGAIKIKFILQYEELISVLPISESDWQLRRSPLFENIRNEGIVV